MTGSNHTLITPGLTCDVTPYHTLITPSITPLAILGVMGRGLEGLMKIQLRF